MAGSINKVILVGNLGADPEVRTMNSGDKLVNLSVATSESWKDKATGERKEKTEWHRVVIFNDRLADVAERFLNKGSKVYLEGQLQTRKWQDQSGQDKYTTEVVLQRYRGELTMLDSKGDGGGSYSSGPANDGGYGGMNQDSNQGSGPQGVAEAPARMAASGGAGAGSQASAPMPDIDDDIPF